MSEEYGIIEVCKKKLGSELIGFEDFIEKIIRIRTNASYPPFNIEIIDSGFKIVIAVAGFNESEIKIKLEGMQLCIFGNKSENENKSYLYKGIATRSFQKSFLLAEGMKINSVNLLNGLLEIIVLKPLVNSRTIEIPLDYKAAE